MGNTIAFKGKTIVLDHDPHTGICNGCRAVVPFDCSRTHMHHEMYDDTNPLAHTIEHCPSCHGKANAEQGTMEGDTNKIWNIKVSKQVHDALGDLGKISETYNQAIRRLIDHYEKTAKK